MESQVVLGLCCFVIMLIFHSTEYNSIQTQEIQENNENPCEEKKKGRKNLHNVLESIDIK